MWGDVVRHLRGRSPRSPLPLAGFRLPAILANNYHPPVTQSLLLARWKTHLAGNSPGTDFQANRLPSDVRNTTYFALTPSFPNYSMRQFGWPSRLAKPARVAMLAPARANP
jgi:hypothetical protein